MIGIDPDNDKLDKIRSGEPTFFEPGLHDYTKAAISNGLLTVTNDPSANTGSDLSYLTVGTPSNLDGSINLEYLKNATASVGKSIRKSPTYQTIVIKSTVTPGTARNVVRPILESESGKSVGLEFGLCSNPEFLREGSAIHDAEFPDRIVIGGNDMKSIDNMEIFYKELHGEHTPTVIRTSHENAELIKYANNAFLALKVSFINSIANITERVPGADVKTIATGIGLDNRIGPKFLNAGLGWGGSCLPKDLKELSSYSKTLSYDFTLIEAAIRVNDYQKQRAVEIAQMKLGSLISKRIAILGLSFKPGTDDMRDAVSVPIIEGLLARGATVVAFDPAAVRNARGIFGNKIAYATNPMNCISGADCAIIVTEWPEFDISPSMFLKLMRYPMVIDGRRVYEAELFIRSGIHFSAIGLGT